VTIERSTPSQQSTLGGGVLKLLLFVNKLGHSVIYYICRFRRCYKLSLHCTKSPSWCVLRSAYLDLPGVPGRISKKTGITSKDCIKSPVIAAIFLRGNTISSVPFILTKLLTRKRSVVWTIKPKNRFSIFVGDRASPLRCCILCCYV
jgi:hypothetical protein